ncbi:MAG: response regulator transcription factor [Sphingopyxis terrae]|nr:response regulator transcription factor [Sphingopyxis terrae]
MALSLTSLHLRETKAVAWRVPTEATDWATGVPDCADDAVRRFRVVELHDRFLQARRDWIGPIFPNVRTFDFIRDQSSHLSQAEEQFDTLLVSGEDFRRIYTIVRETRALFPAKGIVVLRSHCAPALIADFLNRGADDILTCDMGEDEGKARILALLRRCEWAILKSSDETEQALRHERMLRSMIRAPLTDHELRLLEALARCKGRVAAYHYIASRVSQRWVERGNIKSIHVAVYCLRRKLAPHVRIETHTGVGYALRIEHCGKLPRQFY